MSIENRNVSLLMTVWIKCSGKRKQQSLRLYAGRVGNRDAGHRIKARNSGGQSLASMIEPLHRLHSSYRLASGPF
jgi:hypothetical protein